MIKKFNPCRLNSYCSIYSPMNYVKFMNSGYKRLIIKCILQYTVVDEVVTKESTLASNRYKRFNLPGNATNICLNILNASLPDIPFIWHDCILGDRNVCYEVKGPPEHPTCTKTFC